MVNASGSFKFVSLSTIAHDLPRILMLFSVSKVNPDVLYLMDEEHASLHNKLER